MKFWEGCIKSSEGGREGHYPETRSTESTLKTRGLKGAAARPPSAKDANFSQADSMPDLAGFRDPKIKKKNILKERVSFFLYPIENFVLSYMCVKSWEFSPNTELPPCSGTSVKSVSFPGLLFLHL